MKKQFFVKVHRGLLIVTFSVLLAGCGKNSDEEAVKSSMEQGMDAISSGDYSTAVNMFGRAIDEDSENKKQAYRGLGMAYLADGQYDSSIESFKMALGMSNGIINDMDIDISYYLAVAHYRSGDIKKAIETYDAIIALKPNEDNAYYMRGKAKLNNGDKAGALEDYERAVELEPEDYDHFVRICEDLREAGYENEGDEYLRRAMESGNKLSNYQLGVFNYYLGNYNDARNYLENARSDKKQSEDLILYLGRTYEALGDAGYAVSLYEGYIAEGGKSAGAYVRMGLVKMDQKDYQAALEAFEAGIATDDPTYLQSLLYNRIVAYEYLYEWDTAKSLMAEYVQKYPGDEKAARENKFLSTR